MNKIKVERILRVTEGNLICGQRDSYISHISTDSRTIKPGETFLALKGERFDGHSFIQDVVNKGAGGLIVSEEALAYPEGLIIIRVKNTLAALGQIACDYRQGFQIPLVAVTGSNGKTTTKEMLYAILSQRFETVKSEKSFNNDIGLPLTLLELKDTSQAVVVELGMNHPGEISKLAQLAKPTIGIITNVGTSHIGYLGSKENIAQAKAELLPYISQMVCLNRDDDYVWSMRQLFSGQIVSFGLSKEADVRATNLRQHDQGIEFTLNDYQQIQTPVLSLANVYNALAAISVGLHLRIELNLIQSALAQFKPLSGRMELLEINGVKIINDAYNANPNSMEQALLTLKSLPCNARRIMVIGDMLELGDMSEQLHLQTGKLISQSGVDWLITIGELAQLAGQQANIYGTKVIACCSNSEAAERLQELLQPDDWVLLKGSRRMKLEEIVDSLRVKGL